MECFKFVDVNYLNNKHINEIAKLLLETGYYEYISMNNKLGILPIPFQKIQTLEPYAPYTHVLMGINGDIAGFFIAATRQQIEDVEKTMVNWYRDDMEVADILKKLSHFYLQETLSTDLILYGVAISSICRGKGLFKILYNEQVRLAKNNHCSRIIFVVWESNPALNIYQHYGAKILGKFDFTTTWFNDRLIKCSFEL